MKHSNRPRRGSAAEMPLTLLILFAVLAFPLLDLISLGLAYGAVWFVSFQCAQSASTQPDFNGSLSALLKKSAAFNSGWLTNMLKMTPVEGYNGSGTDLFVDAVDFMDAGKCRTVGPNKAIHPPIDLTNCFYEIGAQTTYKVEPFINLQAVPFLASVPALGTPITLSAKVKRCAEFPHGLTRGPGNSGMPTNAAESTQATSFASPVFAAKEATEPWSRPHIYQEIETSGSHIVDHTVVQVKANNARWTDTGLTVKPGQTVWIDFRADGNWGPLSMPKLTADGMIQDHSGFHSNQIMYNLIGSISPKSTFIYRADSYFVAGTQLYKYVPSKTGPLFLGFYDPYPSARFSWPTEAEREAYVTKAYDEGNTGSMIVRIIVCQ